METERLILREITEGDFDALFAVWGDETLMRYYPYRFDAARVRAWIAYNRRRYRELGFGLWALELKETGEVVGDCGLTMQRIDGVIRPEIGYHIARAHQRRGYATEAARACRDWTFEHTPFRIVYSYMKKTNVPSARTAMANGMHWQGEYTDDGGEQTLVYAITREEWAAMQRK